MWNTKYLAKEQNVCKKKFPENGESLLEVKIVPSSQLPQTRREETNPNT